jgi:membrane protein YqaA with SNARE-associated domain
MKKPSRKETVLRIFTLVGVIALIVLLFIFRDQVRKLEEYGYIGIFLISIAANATIIIPLPGVAITSALGAIYNPWGVAVSAGLGAALGELSGYLAGFSGQAVVENSKFYEKLTRWMREHQNFAYVAIALLAFIPNPLFDIAGTAAGALKLPLWKFLAACAIGKIIKMMLFAFAGYYSASWITQFLVK